MSLPDPSPVHIPFASQFDLPSKASGRTYRVMVFKPPLQGPPEGGYPVIVTSDGNLTFPIAAMLNGVFGFGAPNAVVVGVGYATDSPLELGLARRRDLTPPTPLSGIPPSPFWPEPREEDFGGADEFLSFLVDELRPLIAEHWQGNPEGQTLYGHSLGGLFTLHALFSRPDAFRNFVASSPSIWWNDRAILQHVDGFAARVEAGEVSPRVMITIGADEQDPPPTVPPGMTREAADKLVADARMVDNAAELGARLAALKGAPGYVARYRPFAEDDHTTSLATSIARMLSLALRE